MLDATTLDPRSADPGMRQFFSSYRNIIFTTCGLYILYTINHSCFNKHDFFHPSGRNRSPFEGYAPNTRETRSAPSHVFPRVCLEDRFDEALLSPTIPLEFPAMHRSSSYDFRDLLKSLSSTSPAQPPNRIFASLIPTPLPHGPTRPTTFMIRSAPGVSRGLSSIGPAQPPDRIFATSIPISLQHGPMHA